MQYSTFLLILGFFYQKLEVYYKYHYHRINYYLKQWGKTVYQSPLLIFIKQEWCVPHITFNVGLIYKIHSNEKRPTSLEFHYGGIAPSIGSNLQEFIDKTTQIIGTTIDDRQLANLARLELMVRFRMSEWPAVAF